MKDKNTSLIKFFNRFGIFSTVVAIVVGIYIMIKQKGLIDGLDFGAGAYYYADIPQFSKYVNGSHYQSPVSMGVLILLFLIWGFLMYRLWVYIENKK